MKTKRINWLGAVLGAGVTLSATTAFADESSSRQDRMDSAYSNYRNPDPGPAARAESSMKHGAHETGQAIKHGTKATGHAVGTGLSKTGKFLDRGGDKLKAKSSP